jgi:hypothetical protein
VNELKRIEQEVLYFMNLYLIFQYNIDQFPANIASFCKNKTDILVLAGVRHSLNEDLEGTERRCGGLGDVLSGVVAAVISMGGDVKTMSQSRLEESLTFAGELVRRASESAYGEKHRAMSALDVINNIHNNFQFITEGPISFNF